MQLESNFEDYARRLGRDPEIKREYVGFWKMKKLDVTEKIEAMHERREAAKDWVGNALEDLEETKEYIEKWGVEANFFVKRTARLKEIKEKSTAIRSRGVLNAVRVERVYTAYAKIYKYA